MVKLGYILNEELLPAMGCTEPGAIAYACSVLRNFIGKEPVKKVKISVDKNIYKNGMSVGIPNSNNLSGNITAAALGLVGGQYKFKLQALKKISKPDYKKAIDIIKKGLIKINIKPDSSKIYVQVIVFTSDNKYEILIQNYHTNIKYIKKNNRKIKFEELVESNDIKNYDYDRILVSFYKNITIKKILNLINKLSKDDIALIKESIKLNQEMSDKSLKKYTGINKKFAPQLNQKNQDSYGQITFAAAKRVYISVYSRMNGDNIPVMSSGGSGNSGLMITIPLVVYAQKMNLKQDNLIKALALAYIINSWIRLFIGKVGILCGGCIAAGSGLAAGLNYLMGGSEVQIKNSIYCMLNSTVGVLCDGAKISCAHKLSNTIYSCFQSASFGKMNLNIIENQGIFGNNLMETLNNIKYISKKSNTNLEEAVVKIIADKSI